MINILETCGLWVSARKGNGFYPGSDERRRYYTCAKERHGCRTVHADETNTISLGSRDLFCVPLSLDLGHFSSRVSRMPCLVLGRFSDRSRCYGRLLLPTRVQRREHCAEGRDAKIAHRSPSMTAARE